MAAFVVQPSRNPMLQAAWEGLRAAERKAAKTAPPAPAPRVAAAKKALAKAEKKAAPKAAKRKPAAKKAKARA